MDEGMEGRMDEGRDGDKDDEKKKSTVGKSKMNPKIDPRESNNRPKSVKKTKARGTRNQSKVFKMVLDPPPPWGGRFSSYRGRARLEGRTLPNGPRNVALEPPLAPLPHMRAR